MAERRTYQLMPELVPGDLWGRSAFRMLGRRVVWRKKIRPDAIAKAKSRCETCGVNAERPVCHDKWSYDDKKAIATLTGFEIHCGDCDGVTHYKRLMKIADDPRAILEATVVHIADVNRCKIPDAIAILVEADELWAKRNKKTWKVAVAPALLKAYPELEGLPSYKPTLAY